MHVIALTMVSAVLWLLALPAALVLSVELWRRVTGRQLQVHPSARRPQKTAPPPQPASDTPAGDQFSLSCPHCGFTGPLDNINLVGETVDCPLCEQPFAILEPLSPGAPA